MAECYKSTEDKAKCKKALDAAANKRKEKAIRELNLREEVSMEKERKKNLVLAAQSLTS